MSRRTWWLVGVGALVLIVMGVWLVSRTTLIGGPPAPPADFADDTVDLQSPDLDLELVSVTGTVHPSYTEWVCQLVCRESSGCRGDVRAVIHYRSNGERRTLRLASQFRADEGEPLVFRRVQRPPVAVDRVERVVIEEVTPLRPAGPRPTPMM